MAPAMTSSSRSNRSSQSRSLSRHKRSGYEPSDTDTEVQESPWHGRMLFSNRSKTPDPVRMIPISNRSKTPDPTRNFTSNNIQRHTSKESNDNFVESTSGRSLGIRRHSRSPYKPSSHGEDTTSNIGHSGSRRNVSPYKVSEHRNTSPHKVSEQRITSPYNASEHRTTNPSKVSEDRSKRVSPYRAKREAQDHETNELDGLSRKLNQITPPRRQNSVSKVEHTHHHEDSSAESKEIYRDSETSNYKYSRSVSAPKPRATPVAKRRPSPLGKPMIHEENDGSCSKRLTPEDINERIANTKLAKSPSAEALSMQSTESISLDDIFISRDCRALHQEHVMKNSEKGDKLTSQMKAIPELDNVAHQFNRGTGSFNQNPQGVSVSTVLSQTNRSSSSSFGQLSNGRSSTYSSKLSDSSGKLGESFKRIISVKQRTQTDAWLSCVKGRGSCAKSKSPDSRAIETSFIERALVVEELRPFWADKHSPTSLSKFICHKQQSQLLKQLVRINSFWFYMHVHYLGPCILRYWFVL